MDRNRQKSVQVIDRCFAILEGIAKNNGEAALAYLSRSLDFPHSTVHRILSTLIQIGYVEQDPVTGHYRLGLKVLLLSSVILQNLDLRRIARDYLDGLMRETGETANLVVLDRDEVVYIEKVETQASVRVFSLIGKRAPVHVTGAGKVLLSELGQQDAIDILRSRGMPKLTRNSITELPAMLDELAIVRKQGYAFDDEECEVGARCVAAPVRNHTGRIVAAMSVSGPSSRLTPEGLGRIAPTVVKAAARLSGALGFTEAVRRLQA